MNDKQALSSDLWPHSFEFGNFVKVFEEEPVARYALNSFMYAGLATIGMLLSSIPAAYALSVLKWRGRNVVMVLVLVALMLPEQVTIIPVYVLFAKLHLVGTLWPLIIPNWLGDAFSIFLLRQFFLTIPSEYADAARVDGCGELRVLTSVYLRLAKPAIAAAALFLFFYLLERLLRAADLHGRNGGALDAVARARAVPHRPPRRVEPDDGGDPAVHGAR